MRKLLLALLPCLALGAFALENPPVRSVGGTPIGSSAIAGPSLSQQGAHDINRDYYLGADPNFPRGMSHPPRGVR